MLARAWLLTTRAPHLVGTTPTGASGTVNALGPDAHWPPARGLRKDVIDQLAAAEPGLSPDRASVAPPSAGTGRGGCRPASTPSWPQCCGEAEWLGVTGRGAISSAGRALLDGRSDADLAAAMQPHLPEPVEHVLLQADLTAIAPGPLAGGLATFMRLVADVESRGGATVYRFNQDSVRRCLDAGWSVDQVLGALGDASHTPIPQPLDYLIRDVARRHGQARVGRDAGLHPLRRRGHPRRHGRRPRAVAPAAAQHRADHPGLPRGGRDGAGLLAGERLRPGGGDP